MRIKLDEVFCESDLMEFGRVGEVRILQDKRDDMFLVDPHEHWEKLLKMMKVET